MFREDMFSFAQELQKLQKISNDELFLTCGEIDNWENFYFEQLLFLNS